MRMFGSTSRFRLLAGLFSVIVFTGAQCGSPSDQQQAVVGTNSGVVAPTEVANLYTLINQERANRGLGSLTLDTTIQTVSQQISDDHVAANVDAYDFAIAGLDAPTRLRSAGISFNQSVHIGAMDFILGVDVLNALIAVDSSIFTDGNLTRIGLGQSTSVSHNFWTVIVVDQ